MCEFDESELLFFHLLYCLVVRCRVICVLECAECSVVTMCIEVHHTALQTTRVKVYMHVCVPCGNIRYNVTQKKKSKSKTSNLFFLSCVCVCRIDAEAVGVKKHVLIHSIDSDWIYL